MDPVDGVMKDDQEFGFSHYTYIAPDDKGTNNSNNNGGFYIGGDINQAEADVTGQLPTDLQNRVSFDEDGSVNFDASGLSQTQLNDPGVQLLINLTTSGCTYLYTVTDRVTVSEVGVNYDDGKEQGGQIKDVDVLGHHGIVNASKTPAGPEPSNGTTGAVNSDIKQVYHPYYTIPFGSKYDGIVAISGNKKFDEIDTKNPGSTPTLKSRVSVVFHELKENYYRVSGNGYTISHNLAIADQMKFLANDARRSRFPGHIFEKK